MPPKSVKKTTPQPEAVTPVTPVIEMQAEAPVIDVVSASVASTPVKQKGGKKQTKVAEPVVELAPVAAPVAETPVDASVKAPKRGGSKAAKPTVVADATPLVEVAPKAAKAPKVKVQKVATEGQTEEQTGGKPKAAKKDAKAKVTKKVVAAASTSVETDGAVEETYERLIRSFKVKLPDKEEFEGRFTGLTPYQAANKALSKYFRETEHPKPEITFLICESTRKSKKSVYTYVGKRYQLEVPVKYTIQDGREIIKNFKNSLKKVKKVDLLEKAGGAVTPVSEPVVATA